MFFDLMPLSVMVRTNAVLKKLVHETIDQLRLYLAHPLQAKVAILEGAQA